MGQPKVTWQGEVGLIQAFNYLDSFETVEVVGCLFDMRAFIVRCEDPAQFHILDSYIDAHWDCELRDAESLTSELG